MPPVLILFWAAPGDRQLDRTQGSMFRRRLTLATARQCEPAPKPAKPKALAWFRDARRKFKCPSAVTNATSKSAIESTIAVTLTTTLITPTK